MVAIPQSVTAPTVDAIYKSYEDKAERGHRPHLGASVIGHPCDRHLWMSFRWTKEPKFEGHMLRLFETGQKEELRLVADLRRIGVEVHDTQKDGISQWRVSEHGGHFGGSLDAAARGFSESPKAWHVCEFKTANTKSFKDLKDKGVEKSKPQHWAQMQTYMHLTGMERAAYLAKCKDTDELYMERVHYDKAEALKIVERARRVIEAAEPPPKLSHDPSWHICRFCHFHGLCHADEAPEANCRTCAHSTPELDGESRWSCAARQADIDLEQQRKGCRGHRVIPILLERIGQVVDASPEAVTYQTADGRRFVNGDPDQNPKHFSSAEIHAFKDKKALTIDNPLMDTLRQQWGARVVA